MKSVIEPGLLKIFRYFTGVAMVYFAIIVMYTAIQTGQTFTPSQIQSYLNFGINLTLFGYLSWGWLRRKMKRWYLPLALISAAVVPVFSNLIYLAEPQSDDLALTILRSWILLPIVLVPLVLIAWQYQFRYVVAFILVTAVAEISVLLPVVGEINFETLPILGVPMIRAFAFGTVGHIVAHLINTQRSQKQDLLRANVQLSQHAQTLEKLAVSRERNRLARELHDTLAHTLSGQAVNLEAIKLMISTDQAEIHEMLDQSLENVRAGLSETRRALKDLRSRQLDDVGIKIAIRNLALEAQSRANFTLDLKLSADFPDLPPDKELCIYRITQESLENIIRHAGASHVSLWLYQENNQFILKIQDDGIGFDVNTIDFSNKHGIVGMQERAVTSHGFINVYSQPGLGTKIRLSFEGTNDQDTDL
jgi:signal transduction histidine kinase